MPGFAIDDAVRMKANAGEGRREEIAASQAPKNGTAHARRDAGGKQRGKTCVFARRPAFCHLVEMSEWQTICRQPIVDLGHSERQVPGRHWAVLFHPSQLAAKIGNSGRRTGVGHSTEPSWNWNVLHLFSLR